MGHMISCRGCPAALGRWQGLSTAHVDGPPHFGWRRFKLCYFIYSEGYQMATFYFTCWHKCSTSDTSKNYYRIALYYHYC